MLLRSGNVPLNRLRCVAQIRHSIEFNCVLFVRFEIESSIPEEGENEITLDFVSGLTRGHAGGGAIRPHRNVVTIDGQSISFTSAPMTITLTAHDPRRVRSDCNGDALVGISDVIFNLKWLFRGAILGRFVSTFSSNWSRQFRRLYSPGPIQGSGS